MVDPETINVGDIVQVVDRWDSHCIQANNGGMDHWLGRVVTIRRVLSNLDGYVRFRIEEDIGDNPYGDDENRWVWNQYMFNPVEEDDGALIPAASDEDILSLLS